MSARSVVEVDGVEWDYVRLMRRVQGLSATGAKNRIYRMKQGKWSTERFFARPQGVYEIDGKIYTLDQLQHRTGYAREVLYSRYSKYRKGMITAAEMLSPKKGHTLFRQRAAVVPASRDEEYRLALRAHRGLN